MGHPLQKTINCRGTPGNLDNRFDGKARERLDGSWGGLEAAENPALVLIREADRSISRRNASRTVIWTPPWMQGTDQRVAIEKKRLGSEVEGTHRRCFFSSCTMLAAGLIHALSPEPRASHSQGAGGKECISPAPPMVDSLVHSMA